MLVWLNCKKYLHDTFVQIGKVIAVHLPSLIVWGMSYFTVALNPLYQRFQQGFIQLFLQFADAVRILCIPW